jgi:hypothetical protein
VEVVAVVRHVPHLLDVDAANRPARELVRDESFGKSTERDDRQVQNATQPCVPLAAGNKVGERRNLPSMRPKHLSRRKSIAMPSVAEVGAERLRQQFIRSRDTRPIRNRRIAMAIC